MKFMPITEIAKEIRKELKKKIPECKFSIVTEKYSMGRSLTVALMSSPHEIFTEKFIKENKDMYYQINHYCINQSTSLTCDGKDIIMIVNNAIKQYHEGESDPMTDYSNYNFYYSINIGKWNNQYLIDKTLFSKQNKDSLFGKVKGRNYADTYR